MLTAANWLNVFKYGLTGVFLFLDGIVYWLVSKLFALYESLAGAEIVTQEIYQDIVQKFYVVIGVVMLFYIAYSLMKTLINPDDLGKNVGKLITNLIISLILLGVTPTIFNYAFQLQNAIITDHVIDHLIFGTDDSEDNTNGVIAERGREAALNCLTAFLQMDDATTGIEESGEINKVAKWALILTGTGKISSPLRNSEEIKWGDVKEGIKTGEVDFRTITAFVEPVHDDDSVDYIPIVSTLCGAFLAYVLISFCLDLGVRVFKLAFYQIIAPIPILMRIIPEKKSVFDNWVKASLATYMEVFIRMFIMYIIVYLTSVVFSGEVSLMTDVGIFGLVIIVLGLFAFAKQAPKLISNVIGIDSGNLKLGIGGKLAASGFLGAAINNVGKVGKNVGKGALGALTGGLGGMYTSMVNGAGTSGFVYGAYNGWKGKGMQFGKQRQGLYSAYDLKGKAGWFGGRAFFDKAADTAKSKAQDSYTKGQETYVQGYENSQRFKNKFDELYKEKEAKNNEEYQRLYKEFIAAQADFENTRINKLKEYKEQYMQEKEVFENERTNKLKKLALDYEKAKNNSDITKMSEIQKQIDAAKASSYSNSSLDAAINEWSTKQYVDDKLEAKIAATMNIDRNDIMNETQAYFMENDTKYKTSSKYVAQKQAEKDAKEWRENNQEEYLKQVAMYEDAFKRIEKDAKGGAKPPAAPKSDDKK